MGVSIEQSGGRGRRNVDAELNLIPFIDLLSVCILFLLMTAVWVQISKMSAFSQPSGQATVSHSQVASLNEMKEDRDWDIVVKTAGVEIKQDGKILGLYDAATIKDAIAQLKAKYLTNVAAPKIQLRATDDVIYENVVWVLDGLFSNQLTNVTVGGLD